MSINISSSIENKIYFSKYKPDSKIGEGSFGSIYSAHDINNGELCALKFEKRSSNKSFLQTETYLLCYLKGEGIPYIKSYGSSGDYNVLVMELLGKSLEILFEENNNKFSLKTVCMLADQMISRLEYIHKKDILHRDIKPDNFTIGKGKTSHIIYLIDFGLSKKLKNSKANNHTKHSLNKKLIGTARYASINAMKGEEQGKRDDMESLGYVLMYFLRGNLPWQGLKLSKGDSRNKKIFEIKKETTPEELCVGFPKEFREYIRYTRHLRQEQEPDYNYLKKLIYGVMERYEYNFDFLYDWGIRKNKNSLTQINNENNIIINKEFNVEDKQDKNNLKKENIFKKVKSKEIHDNKNKKNIITKQKENLTKNNKRSKTHNIIKDSNKAIQNQKNNIKKNESNNINSNIKKSKNFNKLKTVDSNHIYRKKSENQDNYIFNNLLKLESSRQQCPSINESLTLSSRINRYKFITELNTSSEKMMEKSKKNWITKNMPITKEKKIREDNKDDTCLII